jgi:hypothetical protein
MTDYSGMGDYLGKDNNGVDSFTSYVYLQTDRLEELLFKKQRDYGHKNKSHSPGGPINGLRVRMFDKLARINNLYETGATPENESLRDSFMDLANYGIIALMVLDGQWKGIND